MEEGGAQYHLPQGYMERIGMRPYEEMVEMLLQGDFTLGDQRITREPESTRQSYFRFRLWTYWKSQVKGPAAHYLETLIRKHNIMIHFWSYEPHPIGHHYAHDTIVEKGG
jgi:hypothetical protein